MDLLDRYPNLATFGFMIQDRSRGEVLAGPGGAPLLRYDMSAEDVAQMARGYAVLCEIFLRAGAERVLLMIAGCDEIRTERDLEILRRRELAAGDFEVTAYHPLGTCRMGVDPRDPASAPTARPTTPRGSSSPTAARSSSLGVNPQLTIMALALRTAEAVDARLDDLARAAPAAAIPAAEGRAFTFRETMSGTCRFAASPERERAISFTVTARSARIGEFLKRRVVAIEGTIDVDGVATRRPLAGTLGMDVLLTRRIPYDFTFTGDDGAAYRFTGEKQVRVTALLETMSRLPRPSSARRARPSPTPSSASISAAISSRSSGASSSPAPRESPERVEPAQRSALPGIARRAPAVQAQVLLHASIDGALQRREHVVGLAEAVAGAEAFDQAAERVQRRGEAEARRLARVGLLEEALAPPQQRVDPPEDLFALGPARRRAPAPDLAAEEIEARRGLAEGRLARIDRRIVGREPELAEEALGAGEGLAHVRRFAPEQQEVVDVAQAHDAAPVHLRVEIAEERVAEQRGERAPWGTPVSSSGEDRRRLAQLGEVLELGPRGLVEEAREPSSST